MTAEQAIKNYLASANQDIQSETVKSGDTITVDYIGRLNDSEVFDTSVESVAQASGKYNPNRNYSEGLSFKVGAGQMIAGFDAGVVGMKVGETKTIKIKLMVREVKKILFVSQLKTFEKTLKMQRLECRYILGEDSQL